MTSQRFWSGYIEVCPYRMVEQSEDGVTRKVRRLARHPEEIEGAKRLLAHAGALRLVNRMTIGAGEPFRLAIGVPRLSDDHDADCERARSFISAVFWGEPTEGP